MQKKKNKNKQEGTSCFRDGYVRILLNKNLFLSNNIFFSGSTGENNVVSNSISLCCNSSCCNSLCCNFWLLQLPLSQQFLSTATPLSQLCCLQLQFPMLFLWLLHLRMQLHSHTLFPFHYLPINSITCNPLFIPFPFHYLGCYSTCNPPYSFHQFHSHFLDFYSTRSPPIVWKFPFPHSLGCNSTATFLHSTKLTSSFFLPKSQFVFTTATSLLRLLSLQLHLQPHFIFPLFTFSLHH
jgi:hypothetical protein